MKSHTHRQIALCLMCLRREARLHIDQHLSPLGASAPMYSILLRLTSEPDVPQNELGSDAALDPAGVSRLVARMRSEGLLKTHVDPADRRQHRVAITRKGRALFRSLSVVVDHALGELMQPLTPDEERTLLRLLQKAAASLRQGPEARPGRREGTGARGRRPPRPNH